MAEVSQTRVLPPEFIEAAGKTYLGDLSTAVGGFKGADLSKVYGPQFVAGLDPLQQQATGIAKAGIGAYQPYLQAAEAATGPQGYQQFMSPYQQDVINATLGEYDIQAQKGLGALSQQAIQSGAFGGAREGVAQAEYMTGSDRNRAALQAQLLQQGFGQANQLASQQYQQQLGLGSAQQGFMGQDVGALSTLGAGLQAQRQSELGAQQQLAQQQLNQPLQAAQSYGSGVTSLIAGYPGQTQQTVTPSPSPISTALGVGSTLAGIYRAVNPPVQQYRQIP
ncbi:hypothetical protein N9W29_00325 [Candidatus Pelagibacter bacterium]|nr:hypothetical protein [Candidatus Pelagibacter bacterium]